LKEYILLTINTIKRVFSMIFRLEFKRLWVQAKGFTKYKIYKYHREFELEENGEELKTIPKHPEKQLN